MHLNAEIQEGTLSAEWSNVWTATTKLNGVDDPYVWPNGEPVDMEDEDLWAQGQPSNERFGSVSFTPVSIDHWMLVPPGGREIYVCGAEFGSS